MSKTPAAKFSPMSAEQFAALKGGDMVTAQSGNTYRCDGQRAWEPGSAFFVGQRNGKDFGPSRVMRAGSVAIAAPAAAPVAALPAPVAAETPAPAKTLTGEWWLPMSARRF